MDGIGKILLIMGLVLATAGAIFMAAGKVPFVGRLPGDIRIERENYMIYFPIATCLLISAIATLVMWIISRFRG
jgi:hypothetical protein